MLIFHEGLPGAGKSYAAIKDHVVPALQKGREVFAYIEGLDHDRIALVAGLAPDRVRELLFQIMKEQVPTIYDHVQNDAFVVIDELQDFWPASRTKLEPKITEFVTQHRHRGLDVLLMGQVFMDVHTMWRGRVDQLVFFYNRDAIGKPDEYKWSVRKRESNGKFAEITSGTAKYNPDYFGTYASHTEGTENKEKYSDKRANVWNSPVLKKALPMYGALALVALVVVVWAFRGGLAKAGVEKAEAAGVVQSAKPAVVAVPLAVSSKPAASVGGAEPIVVPADKIQPPGDLVDELTSKYRIRMAGMVESKRGRVGFIEWRDVDGGVKEVLSFVQMEGLGWLVMVSADGGLVSVSKLTRKYYATAWPINDRRGVASETTLRSLKPGEADASAAVVARSRRG